MNFRFSLFQKHSWSYVSIGVSRPTGDNLYPEPKMTHFNKPLPIRVRHALCQPRSANTMPNYGDVIMSVITSQINSLAIVYSTVYSAADQRKHQSSTSLAFVRGIHRGPVNSPHKWPVTRNMFPFDINIRMSHMWYSYIPTDRSSTHKN